MDPRLFGEFMGTLVLVLIGNGAVANVVLKKTLGSAAGNRGKHTRHYGHSPSGGYHDPTAALA